MDFIFDRKLDYKLFANNYIQVLFANGKLMYQIYNKLVVYPKVIFYLTELLYVVFSYSETMWTSSSEKSFYFNFWPEIWI